MCKTEMNPLIGQRVLFARLRAVDGCGGRE
jgi:hypothetical protein